MVMLDLNDAAMIPIHDTMTLNFIKEIENMKTKLSFIIYFIVAVFTGWLAISIAHCPREPSYQGRTLSQWMVSYFDTFGPITSSIELIDTQREASERAINAIGTNAIPTTLRWLSKDYDIRDRFHITAFIRGYPLYSFAETIFEVLGRDAQPATPGLIQLIKSSRDTEVRIIALRLLKKINKDENVIVPVYIECAKNDPDGKVRLHALIYTVEEIGLDSKTGNALVGVLVHDPDKNVRHYAKLYMSQADFRFESSSGFLLRISETNNVPPK
jgi:hypothetical protein